MGCISNFKFPFQGSTLDLDDAFVRKEWFTDGGLWSWGYQRFGTLGNNSTITQSSPVQTISGGTNWSQVSRTGREFASAIKTDGTLWLWGYGYHGIFGNNSTVARSSPVQTVSATTNWKQTASGFSSTSAIKTDGTLWLWGRNLYGELGNNSTIAQSSPVQTVSGGTNWKQVAAGYYIFSSAIKTDGTLWMWGRNCNGELGNNSTVARSSPVQTVSATTTWNRVSVGSKIAAAIKTDGTLWLWGCNAAGEIGNNSTTSRSSPTQTISGGTNWKQVSPSVDGGIVGAIKTDGTLWMWGSGFCGSLGTVLSIGQSSPVQTISGGTNWRQVATANANAGAIKTDGTLWMWGKGKHGALGNNSTIDQSSPVQTMSATANWVQMSMSGLNGYISVAAIRENCW